MAQKFYYNVFISESDPARPIGGWYWIKPSISQVFIYILDGWKPIVGDNPITGSYRTGSFWYSAIEQEAVPTGLNDTLGKIWIKSSIGQAYMKLNGWIPMAGG